MSCVRCAAPGKGQTRSSSAGDVIYTFTPTHGRDSPLPNLQLFWEAFPSGSGPSDRTTYMFTYIDADSRR